MVLGIIFFLVYILEISRNEGVRLSLYIASFLLLYGAMFYGEYKLITLTVDEEADTITDSRQKKYPLKLSQIKTATYKVSKKGRFRSLFLHDTWVGFLDIQTSRENVDRIVAQIRKVNPVVEVKTEIFF